MSGHAQNVLTPAVREVIREAVHEAGHFAVLFLWDKPHPDFVGPQAPYRIPLKEKTIVDPTRPKQGEVDDCSLRYAIEGVAEEFCAGVAAEHTLLLPRPRNAEEPDARCHADWAMVKSLFKRVTPVHPPGQAFHARMFVYCRVSDLLACHWPSVLALAGAFGAEPRMPWSRAVYVFENPGASASSAVTVSQLQPDLSFSVRSVTNKPTVEGPGDTA